MSGGSIRHRVLSGLRWTVLARSTMQLITWASTLIVVRLLSPTDYGLLAMATVVAFYLMMLGEMGLTAALVQRRDIDLATQRSIFGALLIAGVLLFALSSALAPLVARHFSEPRIVPMIVMVSAQFLIMPFTVISQAILSKEMRFSALGIAGIVNALVGATVTLIAAYCGAGAYALILGILVSALARAISINISAPFLHRPSFNFSALRSLATFSGFVLAERSLWYWFIQFDTLIVGSFLGAALLGVYSVAKQLAVMPLERFAEVMNTVAMPAYSAVQHDMDIVHQSFLKALRLSALIVIPAFWGLGLVAQDLVHVVLGPKWLATVPVLSLLCAMMPLRALGSLASPAVTSVGRPDVSFKCVIINAIVVIPAVAIGTHWQLRGVAAAWAISYPVAYIASTRLVGLCMKLSWRQMVAPLAKPLACGLLMAVAVFAFQQATISWKHASARLVCLILLGVLSYCVSLWFIARTEARELIAFAKSLISR